MSVNRDRNQFSFFDERAAPAAPDTLADARALVLAHRDEGIPCPCCGQLAKVYRRKLNGAMAAALCIIARKQRGLGLTTWIHVPNLLSTEARHPRNHGGDFAKLTYWELLEEKPGERDDGSTRVGYYRVTPRGFSFVDGRMSVPARVIIYDSACLGFEGTLVSIHECLGERFSYAELMQETGT